MINFKKVLTGFMSAAMVLTSMSIPAFADGETGVAKIGETTYSTLVAAIAEAQSGDVITLLSDASGDGIEIPSNKNLTIDFDTHTYDVTQNLVGSERTKTNAYRFLENSNVTLKNGTIKATASGTFILVQNYSDLTLEDMTLDFKKYPRTKLAYTLSCNKGNTLIKGNTQIIAPTPQPPSSAKGYAINVYNDATYDSVSLTIDDSMTGTVTGNIEIAGETVGESTQSLIINGGTYSGIIYDNRDDKSFDVIDIYGGTFENKKSNAKEYIPDGYLYNPVTGSVNTLEDSISKQVTVSFAKVSGQKNQYDIYIDGDQGMINGLLSADLTFKLTVTDPQDAIDYTIEPADNINIIQQSDNRFEFNYNGTDASTSGEPVSKVKIGTVVFNGYGSLKFNVDDAATNIVNTTKLTDSIVNSYDPNGDGITTGKLNIIDDKEISTKLTQPTKRLTVNVAFPNSIGDNPSDYQDMTITVSGADLSEPIVKKLGTDGVVKLKNNAYKTSMSLTQNTAYTVTVSGAGYRTARYTVSMTGAKTLNFWNNVKDEPTVIERGSTGMEVKTNFLAGDIVKDGQINIYDLSAVVSYFGTDNLVSEHPTYAKYDLNRDGVIDSKDVAYVLVSWGK